MQLSRNPEQIDAPPPAMVRHAAAGLRIVPVLCGDPGEEGGDGDGAQFNALVAFLPRPGEQLALGNGRRCVVQQVVHRVTVERAEGEGLVTLQPVVLAVLLPESGESPAGWWVH